MIPPMSRATRASLLMGGVLVLALAAGGVAIIVTGGRTTSSGTSSSASPGSSATAPFSDLRVFDLPSSTQAMLGISVVAGGGGDVSSVSQLSSSATVKTASKAHGFLGEHSVSYASTGLDPTRPDGWPAGASGIFLTGVDLFPTDADAQALAQVRRDDLVASGFQVIGSAPLGPGETILQQLPAGSTLLTTVVNFARGPVLIRVASNCGGCPLGTVPDPVAAFVKAQVDQAVAQGLPSK